MLTRAECYQIFDTKDSHATCIESVKSIDKKIAEFSEPVSNIVVIVQIVDRAEESLFWLVT